MGKYKAKHIKIDNSLLHRVFVPLLIICLAVIVYCAYGTIRGLHMDHQGDSFYSDMVSDYINVPPVVEDADDADDTGSAWVPYVDFQSLSNSYPEIVAWIVCEGTKIDYPVMQADDNEYYLEHLPDGTENRNGSIFLNYGNAFDFSDRNSILYGHHLKNGSMFSSLENYKKQTYYDEHPTIFIYTPEKDYKIELFSGYVIDGTKELLPLGFRNNSEFQDYVTSIRQRSTFQSDVEVGSGDQLVTLYTCTYSFENARFILVGKLVEVDGV